MTSQATSKLLTARNNFILDYLFDIETPPKSVLLLGKSEVVEKGDFSQVRVIELPGSNNKILEKIYDPDGYSGKAI